ncbi:hypothetical protein ETU09_08065 [Apibacter muscae]|uniref:Phage tail tape measure protein domain-containing protein n=1 Tax=Apibacter muscae TaxID=2509004 RepID=A0A563DA26_9FLAO|nr:phage tail tape measure protein [Apibacter muscae]TWP27065.1 hypothetical protein ETU09_08065 [Apibacter muscae]
MAEKISIAELDWDTSLLEKSIQNYTQKLQIVKKEQDGVILSLNTMTSEYEKLSKVVNLFTTSDKSMNVELEKNKKQMDELKASMRVQAETIANLQAQVAQLNKERTRANEILEMTKQKEKANSDASQKNAQATIISLQKVNKELEKTQNAKVTTVDLNVDSFLSKAAEARKQVEILKGEVKFFTDAIKENEKTILEDSEVLSSLARQGKSNSDEYKERARLIKELQDKNKGLRNELELNASALRKEQQELRNSQRQVDAFNKTLVDEYEVIIKTDGSINPLSQALANNRKIYRDLTAEQRNNIEVGGRLLNIIQAQDNEYKELQKSTGVNQVEVGNYRGQLEGLFETLQGGATPVQALTGEFKGLYSQALALGSNPIGAFLIALAGVAKLTKMWYDYNVEMSKSTRLVQQFTSLSGDALTDLTVKVRTLSKESGESEKQTLNAVNAVANSMGISYEDAFNKVTNGFIRSGESAEDFFDNTSEYVSHFKNMGYSADEFFSIMEEGAKAGTYKDKLVDTIKEFSIRFNDLNKAGKESLDNTFGKAFIDNLIKQYKAGEVQGREVLDKLIKKGKELGLSFKDTGAVVANVMGSMGEDTGGYEHIVKALNNGLENTHRELTEIEKARQIEIKSTEALNQKWAQLFNTSGGTFEMMKAQGKSWVNGTLIKMIDGIIEFANGFIETYNSSMLLRGAIGSIGTIFQVQMSIATSALKLLWNNLKSSARLIKSLLTLDLDGIKDSLKDGFIGMKDIAISGAKDIKNAYESAINTTINGKLNKIEFSSSGLKDEGDSTNTAPINKYTAPIQSNAKNKKADKEATKEAERQLKVLDSLSNAQMAILNNAMNEQRKRNAQIIKENGELTQEILDQAIKRIKSESEFNKNAQDEELRRQISEAELKIKNTEEREKKINELIQESAKKRVEIEAKALEEEKKIQDKYDAQIRAKKAEEFAKKIEDMKTRGVAEWKIKEEQLISDKENDKKYQEMFDEKAAIEKKEQDAQKLDADYQLDQETLDRKAALVTGLAQLDYEYKQAEINNAVEKENAKFMLYAQGVQGMLQLMGAQTEASKVMGIADATIKTYQGAADQLTGLKVPFNIIAAATTISYGLAQVSKIAGINIPAFEGIANIGGAVQGVISLKNPDAFAVPSAKKGYFKGGYTGGNSIYEERGAVHGKEVVFNHKDVEAYGGWQNIELLRPTSDMFQGFPVNTQMILASSQNSNNIDLSSLSSTIKQGVYEGALNGSKIGSQQGSQIGSLQGSQAGSQKGISQLTKNQRISDGAGF